MKCHVSRILLFTISLWMSLVGLTCSSGSGDRIIVRSVDWTQEKQFEIGEVSWFKHFSIDYTDFIDSVRSHDTAYYCLNESQLRALCRPDSSSSVFVIRSVERGLENEIRISLCGTVRDDGLANLYYIEVGGPSKFWRNTEGGISALKVGESHLDFSSVLVSIGYALSDVIRFPYNSDGGYDPIEREMTVSVRWEREK